MTEIRPTLYFGLLVVWLGICYSCGATDRADPSQEPTGPAASVEPTSDTIADYHDPSEGSAEPSAQQLALLEDGVTFAEYESSVFAMVECMEGAGIEMRESPSLDISGIRYLVPYRLGFTEEEANETREKWARCYTIHLAAVDEAWARANMVSEADLQRAFVKLRDCLTDAGLQVPQAINERDFDALEAQDAAAFQTCKREVAQEFTLSWGR